MSTILAVLPQISYVFLVLLSTHTLAINYAVGRNDVSPRSTRQNLLSTRQMLRSLNFEGTMIKSSYTLQEATEHLLIFGALFRMRILNAFGSLLFHSSKDFDTSEVAYLDTIYRSTFERKYSVLALVPDALADLDTRPSKICRLIRDNVNTRPAGCCHEVSDICERISERDEEHTDTVSASVFKLASHVHESANLSQHYPDGIHLNRVLHLLKADSLQLTPSLLLGIIHHVRYDNAFDDRVYASERELTRLLVESLIYGKDSASWRSRLTRAVTHDVEEVRSLSELLRSVSGNEADLFPDHIKSHVRLLSESIANDRAHVVPEAVHVLRRVYENDTVALKYLFDLVLQEDALEIDVIEARDFLVEQLQKFSALGEYLDIDRYQYHAPERLVVEILSQLKEIDYAGDIASALRVHATFSRGTRVIDRPSDLLELFDAYENLRRIPRFGRLMTVIDGIKRDLRNSKNVSIESLCRAPRPCLRRSLSIVQQCTHVNSATKDLISEFLTYVTPTCAFTENRCPKSTGTTVNTSDIMSPSIPEDKGNSLAAVDVAREDASAKSSAWEIPVNVGDYSEKMLPTTDGFEKSDRAEVIYDSESNAESNEFIFGEAWTENESWKDSFESEMPEVKFIDDGSVSVSVEAAVRTMKRTFDGSIKDFVSSSRSMTPDDLKEMENSNDAESCPMTKRSTVSGENMNGSLNQEGTGCNDSSLLLRAYTRQTEFSMISSALPSSILTGAKEATLIVTITAPMTVEMPKMTEDLRPLINKPSKITTIPASIGNAETVKVIPSVTRPSTQSVSAQNNRKVSKKRLARSKRFNLNYVAKNKNFTQSNGCSLRCESLKCPGRTRCPKGKRDSSVRCAKDSSEKPEVVPRFEEPRERTRTRCESSGKEFGKDALCRSFNYRFHQNKSPEREISVSTYYSALSSNKRDVLLLDKARKWKAKSKNRSTCNNNNEILGRKKSRNTCDARQIIFDRIKSSYKLVKGGNVTDDRKAKKAPITFSFNAYRTLPEDRSKKRSVTVTVENFLRKNGSRNPRIESRRKKKIAKRRRQSRIVRPKGRKHNKMHVKTHAWKSVSVYQKHRRKSIKSHRRVKAK